MNFTALAKSQGKRPRYQNLTFWETPLGLITDFPALTVNPQYAVTSQNLFINVQGQWQLRPGLKKVTTAAAGNSIKLITRVPIGGTYHILLVDSDNKLYDCSGSEPSLDPGTAVTTLEGEATIIPFHDYAVILDGSYIKYYDGSTVKIAYDDGSGSDAVQHDSTCQNFASSKERKLYSGATTRVGCQFTTQTWDSGYTMDITRATFWIKKTGTPTGTAVVKIYDDNAGTPNTVQATSDSIDVSKLTKYFTEQEFNFDSGVLALSSNTTYHAIVEYSSGDASNYITVAASDEGSGGDLEYYDGSWNDDATADALARIKPGKPPEASFGDSRSARLYVSGGSAKPGYIYFSNVNTLFDWSTPDAAGYVSAVDDNANSFPVGAIVAHYGDLYIFGQKSQPYLAKLIGATPSQFALPPMWQKTYTGHKTLISLPNDVWVASGDGLNSLTGVQEYGDLRMAPYSYPVQNQFQDGWNVNAFIGFNPKDNQILVKFENKSNTYVCHLNQEEKPWTEFAFNGVTPTAFGNYLGNFYVGGSNGHLYKFDDTLSADDGSDIDAALESGNIEQPFGQAYLDTAYIVMAGGFTGFSMKIYVNGETSATFDQSFSNDVRPMQRNVHLVGDSFKVKLYSFSANLASGYAMFSSLIFTSRRLKQKKNV